MCVYHIPTCCVSRILSFWVRNSAWLTYVMSYFLASFFYAVHGLYAAFLWSSAVCEYFVCALMRIFCVYASLAIFVVHVGTLPIYVPTVDDAVTRWQRYRPCRVVVTVVVVVVVAFFVISFCRNLIRILKQTRSATTSGKVCDIAIRRANACARLCTLLLGN